MLYSYGRNEEERLREERYDARLMHDEFRQSLERATYDLATADGFPTDVTLQMRVFPLRVEMRQEQQLRSRP